LLADGPACPKANSVIESLARDLTRRWNCKPPHGRAQPCNWILDCFLFELHSGRRVPLFALGRHTRARAPLTLTEREDLPWMEHRENCEARETFPRGTTISNLHVAFISAQWFSISDIQIFLLITEAWRHNIEITLQCGYNIDFSSDSRDLGFFPARWHRILATSANVAMRWCHYAGSAVGTRRCVWATLPWQMYIFILRHDCHRKHNGDGQ